MASLTEHDIDGIRVLRLSGSLTQQGVADFEPAFQAALPDGVRAVVDLDDVDLISTPGLALIISTTQRLKRTSGRVVFTAGEGIVRDLIRRCRLDEVLDVAANQDDAMRRINA
jgi:anti-anti-sigma factor